MTPTETLFTELNEIQRRAALNYLFGYVNSHRFEPDPNVSGFAHKAITKALEFGITYESNPKVTEEAT